MKKFLRVIFDFITTGKIVYTGFGTIWAISLWELFLGGAPATLLRIGFWIVFILGSGILLGAVATFLEEESDDSSKRKL